MKLAGRGSILKKTICLGGWAFFLCLFWGCAEVKSYMAQREQDKALENLKKGILEGQKYRNQLYECELIGPANWKGALAYPEALVVFTKDDKITRIKLEVQEVEGEKGRIELKNLITEKEKIPTYKKIKEQKVKSGKRWAWEVSFQGRWREEAKGDFVTERLYYFETKKYFFILSFYTLDALWERNQGIFDETLRKFAFKGETVAENFPSAPGTSSTVEVSSMDMSPGSPSPSAKSPCNPTYSGKVTQSSENKISLNLGSKECIKKGMTGKVYYEKTIEGMVKNIYIARFKITGTSPHNSTARILESTDTVAAEHFIQIDR